MPDPFDDLARALRQGAGEELRAEAEEDENLTEIHRRRHRGLADVVRTAMHRGDRVAVNVAGLTLTHPLVATGIDYLVMDSGDGTVDVRLDGAIIDVEPRSAGGHSTRPPAATFQARLAEHEQSRRRVEIVTTDGRRLAGRIEVASIDHIGIGGDSRLVTFVPTALVAVVFSRLPPERR